MANFEKKDKKKAFAFVEDQTINPNEKPSKAAIQDGRGDTAKKRGKVGAPFKAEKDKRNHTFTVACTKTQKGIIQEKADKAGLTVSAYVLYKVLND